MSLPPRRAEETQDIHMVKFLLIKFQYFLVKFSKNIDRAIKNTLAKDEFEFEKKLMNKKSINEENK